MASNTNSSQEDTSNVQVMSDRTKIFLMGQIQSLIKTAGKLRSEAERAPGIAGELGDRAAEVLCVVSSLLAMLAQSTREEAESLREEFGAEGVEMEVENLGSSDSSGSVSPFYLDESRGNEERGGRDMELRMNKKESETEPKQRELVWWKNV